MRQPVSLLVITAVCGILAFADAELNMAAGRLLFVVSVSIGMTLLMGGVRSRRALTAAAPCRVSQKTVEEITRVPRASTSCS
jgi:hypothetical protein